METGFSFTMWSFCGPCAFSSFPPSPILPLLLVNSFSFYLTTRWISSGALSSRESWHRVVKTSISGWQATLYLIVTMDAPSDPTPKGDESRYCAQKKSLQCVHEVNLLLRTGKWIVTSLPGVYRMCLKRAFRQRISKEKSRVIIFYIIKIHQ